MCIIYVYFTHFERMFNMKRLMELSSQQKNIWNSEMFYSNTNINNIGGYLLINEPVNIDLLEKAANQYIKTRSAVSCKLRSLKNKTQLLRLFASAFLSASFLGNLLGNITNIVALFLIAVSCLSTLDVLLVNPRH